MRRTSIMRVVAVASAVALLAGACSKSAENTSSGNSSTTNQAEIVPGGTFTFGQTSGVTQLDPNIIGLSAETQLLTLLWNGMTKWGSDGSTQPDLATKWEVSADGLQWTFTLRGGVKFHDGKAFTAADVKKNIERVLDPKVPSQARVKIAAITKVTAKDDTTVVIDTKTPTPGLPTALIDVKMTDIDNLADINKTANGTGPYKLTSFVPGQSVDLVRNDAYWGGTPNFEAVKIVRYADATAAQTAASSGALSLLANVPSDAIDSLSSGGLQVLQATDPAGAAVFEVDTTSKPFSDVRARQALSYATDRQSMLDAAYAGRGVLNEGNAIVSPKNKYYNAALSKYTFDLDKAKDLFAQAGVTSGSKLTFWAIAGSYPEFVTMGQILQRDLAKIGITLDIKTSEVSTWAAKFYPNGKSYPNMIVPNSLSFPPAPVTYSTAWFSATGSCECNWKGTQAYNDAMAVVESSADQAKVTEAFATIQQILGQEAPITVVLNAAPISVAQAKVAGAWVQSDGSVHIEDAGFTK